MHSVRSRNMFTNKIVCQLCARIRRRQCRLLNRTTTDCRTAQPHALSIFDFRLCVRGVLKRRVGRPPVVFQPSSTVARASMVSLNVRATVAPLRTLMTSAGRKHAKQVPPLCRTLG